MFNKEFSNLDEAFLGDMFKKISNLIKKAARKVKQLAKKGVAAILKFFGFFPDSVQMSDVTVR